MVFYADTRVPPFTVQVNGNFVRVIVEETHDLEITDSLLEAVCARVEKRVGNTLWVDFSSDHVGETILDCYQAEVCYREEMAKQRARLARNKILHKNKWIPGMTHITASCHS